MFYESNFPINQDHAIFDSIPIQNMCMSGSCIGGSCLCMDFCNVSPDDLPDLLKVPSDETDKMPLSGDILLGSEQNPFYGSPLTSFDDDIMQNTLFCSPRTLEPVKFSGDSLTEPILNVFNTFDDSWMGFNDKEDLAKLIDTPQENYRDKWLSTHNNNDDDVTKVSNNLDWNNIKYILDDHCYSALHPDLQIKKEPLDDDDYNDDSDSYRPPSALASSEPDVETMPLYASDDDMPIKQEPRSYVPKSVGKNMSLLLPKQPASTKRKRGRKPKNAVPAKRARVGRPRTAKNVPRACFDGEDLEVAIAKNRCRKNTRSRTKIVQNSVETSPPTSVSSQQSSRLNTDESSQDSLQDIRLSDEKRASHNLAERERRQELSSLFLNLKSKLPGFKNGDKASKVLILKNSAELITDYRRVEMQLLIQRKEQLRRMKRLTEKLSTMLEST